MFIDFLNFWLNKMFVAKFTNVLQVAFFLFLDPENIGFVPLFTRFGQYYTELY